MDRIKTIESTNLKTKNLKKKQLQKIHHEYRLKQTNFNPTNPSPNLFVKKLEFRMKKYYNTLISSV